MSEKFRKVNGGGGDLYRKIKNLIQKSYHILCIIMFLIFLLFLLLIIENAGNFLIAVIVLIGAILYLLFLVSLYRKFKKMKTKLHDRLAILLSIVFFIFLTMWGLGHKILLGSDILWITDKVLEMINTNIHIIGNNEYLAAYPHQLPLTFFLYTIGSFGNLLFHNVENTIIIYNCFMIALSMYFVYKILKELFDSKIALVGMILYFLYPMFYLNASLYYTDIISIPFPIIGFYFLIRANKQVKIKKYLSLILGGILFAIGSKIRVVSSFLLIAYFIDLILKEKKREILKKGLPVICSFLVIFLLYNMFLLPYFKVEIDKSKAVPPTHFLMMGANNDTNGFFSADDLAFTRSQKDKTKANLEQWKERIKNDNLDFYLKKMAITWTDNSYIITYFYNNMLKLDETQPYIIGYNSLFLKNILRIMRFVFYFLFLIMIGKELSNKDCYQKSKNSSFVIAIFGAFVFYLFWEANERYSFSFLPWIILGGASSISFLDRLLYEKSISFNNQKIELSKVKRNIGFILLICLGILLVDGFIEYSIQKKDLEMIRINNNSKKNKVDIKENDEVVEYFEIDKNFNNIELYFDDTNIKKQIPYAFELYDEKNQIIYKKKFLSTIKKGINKIEFRFPVVSVKKKQKYHFEVYSNKATKTNFLQILTNDSDNCEMKSLYAKNTGYDTNPVGKTYVNGKLICFKLTNKVSEFKFSNRIRKKYYIPFAIIIFGITFYGVYDCLIKKSKN